MSDGVLYLSDNSWVGKRGEPDDPVRDDTGAVPADGALTARLFLSAFRTHDAAPIHATLDAANVPIAGGQFRTVFGGTNVRTHLTPLLDAAEQAGGPLKVYDHCVVAGSHHDVRELAVLRERMV